MARGVASSQPTDEHMGQQQAKEEMPRAQPTYDRWLYFVQEVGCVCKELASYQKEGRGDYDMFL